MPKKILGRQKRAILKAIALGNEKKETIAKRYNIHPTTIPKLIYNNPELFQNYVDKMKKIISATSLRKAEKAISKINSKKLAESSALSLSQTAKNLVDITKSDQSNVNILVNLPESRDELLNIIRNASTDIQSITNNPIENTINTDKDKIT